MVPMKWLTHWYANTREWIKKAVLMDDLYVLNNPWAVQSMEKQTSYCAMMRLGMPIPDTWLVPPKEYDSQPDLQPTLERYARYFDLEELGEKVLSERLEGSPIAEEARLVGRDRVQEQGTQLGVPSATHELHELTVALAAGRAHQTGQAAEGRHPVGQRERHHGPWRPCGAEAPGLPMHRHRRRAPVHGSVLVRCTCCHGS